MSLDFEDSRLQEWIRQTALGLGRWASELERRPVLPPLSAAEIRERFDEPLPEEETPVEDLLEIVEEEVFDSATLNAGPHFYGYITGGGNQLGILAEMVKAGLNQNNLKWHSSPVSTELERLVCRWVAEFVGYPTTGAGVLLDGGSVANFESLAVARRIRGPAELAEEGLHGQAPMTVYVSTEGHSSFDKAVDVLGIGRRQLRKIDVDEDFRLDVDALERQVEADRRDGFRPLCAVAIAGTTNTGAVDDLQAVARVCEEQDLWMHVDAAYGGPAARLASMGDRFAGIERADSLVVNPHKWMYVPFGAACVLVRDGEHLRRTFGGSADYLRSDRGVEDRTDLMDYNLPLTKEFRALKVWMTLKAYGARRLREAIQADVDKAAHLVGRIEAAEDFELLAPAPLSIVCFRHRPPGLSKEELDRHNERLLRRLEREGRVFVTGTKIRGHTALRACIINHRVERRHVDRLFEVVAETARNLQDEDVRDAREEQNPDHEEL